MDPRPFGFDAAVEFPPHPFEPEARRGSGQAAAAAVPRDARGATSRSTDEALRKPVPDYQWYRGLVPGWDNTARRGHDAYIAVGSSPDAYRRWLGELVRQALERADATEPLVFVNAWNEWAEGTHLEPDDRYGRAWLEATRDGLADGTQAIGMSQPTGSRPGPVERLRQQKLPHGQNLKSAGTSRLNGCDRSLRSTSRARSGPLPRAFETRPWKIP